MRSLRVFPAPHGRVIMDWPDRIARLLARKL
jgi:hypothetical protein